MADLPKIAVQRLHGKGLATGTHPDANLISAFVENALSGDSHAQVLQHVAQCDDCREIVFLSTPDQVATLPGTAAAPSNWLAWPVLRWGAAVAAVVVVVTAVTLHPPLGRRFVSSSSIQQTDAPIANERAASAPAPEEKRETAAAARISPVPPVVTNGATAKVNDQGFKKQAASPMLGQESPALGAKIAAKPSGELARAQPVDLTAEQARVQAEKLPAETSQRVPARAKDAAAEPAADTGGGIGSGVRSSAPAASRSNAAMLMPTAAPRWTLTSEGTLQRSLDYGRTWQTIPVAGQAAFRALAASGRDIWVGGSKGALYHSTDAGENWLQVQPVTAGQPLTDDIIGVEFPDALDGKLTTSAKDTWTTSDGGQTWNRQ